MIFLCYYVSTVCIQDAMGRFCMSVMVDSELITPAARACAGTDCNNANCRVAIDEVSLMD